MFPSFVRIFALLCALVSVLCAEPNPPVTPASISQKMARHIFQTSGSPVLLRGIKTLTDCPAIGSGGVWVVPEGDAVTEFVYSAQAICVTVFVRTAQDGNGVVRFDPGRFETKFGPVPEGGFSVRQRLAFIFPSDPSIPPAQDELDLFLRKVAKPVNLQHAGALASAMKEVEADEPDSPAPADQTEQPPGSQKETGGPAGLPMKVPAWILWVSISLCSAAVLLYAGFRFRAARAPKTPEPVAEEPPPEEPPSERVIPSSDGLGRRMLSLPVKSEGDKKLVSEIDTLILDLTRKAGFKWREVEEITKQAQKVSAMAAMENLPVLEIVKEFLNEQIKQSHVKKGAVSGRSGPR